MIVLDHLLAIAALGALCGAWVALQRWLGRLDPEAPGVEGCVGCSRHAEGKCERPRGML